MLKKYENKIFIFVFFFTSLLVFLSRQIQINYINKFPKKFYIFNDPILNPDGYFFLNNIKNQLINNIGFFEKLFSKDLLTLIYVFLLNILGDRTLPEIVMFTSPYWVLVTFFGIFFFFNSIIDKKLSLIVSFSFIISTIFLNRSYVLFLDTDTLNIFFTFFILFILSSFFKTNLSRKKFYLLSIILIIFTQIFFFHYPKNIFPLLFLFITIFVFVGVNQKKKDKFLIIFLFFLSIIYLTGLNPIKEVISKHEIYSTGKIINDESIINVSSSVSELKILNLFEIEKLLFGYNFFYLNILISIFGLFLYFKKNISKIILFFPFFIFSYLTFTQGIRFLIYSAPFIYFGFFYFFYFLNNILKNKYDFSFHKFNNLIVLLIILVVWKISLASCVGAFSLSCKQKYVLNTYFDKEIIKGILKFNNFKNYYNIITSLDYGYLIDYYTNSDSVINPGSAFNKNKYKLFYSSKILTNEVIKQHFNLNNENKNFIFLTKDFVDWWPTISKLYTSKDDKISNILTFTCKTILNDELNCVSKNGLKSVINLNEGYIDQVDLIYKVIKNYKNSSTEEIINKNGEAIVVYSPELKYDNLYVVFPKEFESLIFIKYFFSKVENANVSLVDDGWPYYRTYEVY